MLRGGFQKAHTCTGRDLGPRTNEYVAKKHNGVVFFVFKGLPSTQTHDTMEVTPGGTQLHPWYLK